MRSRARITHVKLVAAVPSIRNTLLLLTIFLFNQLCDKDALGDLSPVEFSARIKSLKKILKAVENISENVEMKTNKWEDALKHCDSLDALISLGGQLGGSEGGLEGKRYEEQSPKYSCGVGGGGAQNQEHPPSPHHLPLQSTL